MLYNAVVKKIRTGFCSAVLAAGLVLQNQTVHDAQGQRASVYFTET